MNLKKGNIVKCTTSCRGINGDGASKSKNVIQLIVDYIYIYIYIYIKEAFSGERRYDCPIYRMHGA